MSGASTDVTIDPGTEGSDSAVGQQAARSVTPTAWARLKKARVWIVIAAVGILLAIVTLASQGLLLNNSNAELDIASANPNGAKALYATLGGHGVNTHAADSFAEVLEIDAEPASTTLVIHDRRGYLDDALAADIRAAGFQRVILIGHSWPLLDAFDDVVEPAGRFPGAEDTRIPAGQACEAPIAANAPSITQNGGRVYTPVEGADAVGCYFVNGAFAVVIADAGTTEFVAFGATENIKNERIDQAANASLAFNVFGTNENLVWYTPSVADIPEDDLLPGYDRFLPHWLFPGTILAFVCAIAIIMWRGRRFGPLVTERLPVTVRAAETLEGRARLYAKSNARLRALDNLRIGTIARLARALNLDPSTPAWEVADACAATARIHRTHARLVLMDAVPNTESELVSLSDELLRIERAVHEALQIPPATPPRTAGN